MQHHGHYTDGRTARRQPVLVQATATGLRLFALEDGRAGAHVDDWPYAGLYLAEEAYGDGPVRLRQRERGDATLSFPTAGLLDEIQRLGGPRLRGRPWLRPTLTLAAVAGVLAVVVIGVGLWGLPRLLAPLAHWVPVPWEEALGTRVMQRFTAGRPRCTGEAGAAALDELAGRLAAELGGEDALPYPLHVHVLADDVQNAFAVPGGHVVLMDGLLQRAEASEEVAGVLAHEIAHAARRHPMQGFVRAAGTRLLLDALLADRGALDAAAARFTEHLVLAAHSRADERAADRLAMRLLNGADIRGAGLATLLQRMAQRRGPGVPPLLSTHPVTAERIEAIQAQARGTGPALPPAQWQALRGICGPDPARAGQA